jgi:hypothetical protein
MVSAAWFFFRMFLMLTVSALAIKACVEQLGHP